MAGDCLVRGQTRCRGADPPVPLRGAAANHCPSRGAPLQRINMAPPSRTPFVTRRLISGPYDEQLTMRCFPQFGGAAA